MAFRLWQQGQILPTGFSGTEYIDDTAVTTPAYLNAFVMSSAGYGMPDMFYRVAVPSDYGTMTPNPLIAFDYKGPLTNTTAAPQPGDTLRLYSVPFPHWILPIDIDGTPYTQTDDGYSEFTITNIVPFLGKQPGDGPTQVSGYNVIASNYEFSINDIGRIITLSGFSWDANNVTTPIIGVNGGMAITTVNFITELITSSASWTYNQFLLSPAKPILRIESGVSWQVRSATSGLIIAAGPTGSPMRQNPRLASFSDDRYTLVSGTQTVIQNHFTLVQSYLESLEQALTAVAPAFQSAGPYDFES
jgi:hypothetical protein